jgi:predicted nucleic acid-binding protein
MIRVVFDTNVLFSAAFKQVGVPAQNARSGCSRHPHTVHIRRDHGRVSRRAHLARSPAARCPRTGGTGIEAKFAVHVSPARRLSLCADPDDDCFLDCALAAEAAYLVTGNVRHAPKDYEPVAIVTPRQRLTRLIAERP